MSFYAVTFIPHFMPLSQNAVHANACFSTCIQLNLQREHIAEMLCQFRHVGNNVLCQLCLMIHNDNIISAFMEIILLVQEVRSKMKIQLPHFRTLSPSKLSKPV